MTTNLKTNGKGRSLPAARSLKTLAGRVEPAASRRGRKTGIVAKPTPAKRRGVTPAAKRKAADASPVPAAGTPASNATDITTAVSGRVSKKATCPERLSGADGASVAEPSITSDINTDGKGSTPPASRSRKTLAKRVEPAATSRGQTAGSGAKPTQAKRKAVDAAVGTAAGSPGSDTTDITAPAVGGRVSKKATCLGMLSQGDGASIAELMEATGWQAHSVRGFLSGEVRTRMGRELTVTVLDDGDRRYRIARGA